MQLFLLAAVVVAGSVTSVPLAVNKADSDPNVASLTALKPRPDKKWNIQPKDTGVTKIKSSGLVQELQQIKQDIGGHHHVSEKSRGEVSKNGNIVGSISRSLDSRASPGERPHTSSLTELEVPSLGIHQRVLNKDEEQEKITADPETAAELAAYVLETGDQASVVQFLQLLLQEGKLNEEQALLYVDTIKKDIAEMEREEREEKEEREQREGARDDLDRVRKLVEAEERAKEERSVMEKVKSLREMSGGMEKEDEDEHDLILRINEYLEDSLKEGKISKNLYNHLKEALIESVVERMKVGARSLDYSHY